MGFSMRGNSTFTRLLVWTGQYKPLEYEQQLSCENALWYKPVLLPQYQSKNLYIIGVETMISSTYCPYTPQICRVVFFTSLCSLTCHFAFGTVNWIVARILISLENCLQGFQKCTITWILPVTKRNYIYYGDNNDKNGQSLNKLGSLLLFEHLLMFVKEIIMGKCFKR
jgi:hypothetical protein